MVVLRWRKLLTVMKLNTLEVALQAFMFRLVFNTLPMRKTR